MRGGGATRREGVEGAIDPDGVDRFGKRPNVMVIARWPDDLVQYLH